MLSPDEIRGAVADALLAKWLEDLGITRGDLDRFYEAIPAEYAGLIEDLTDGRVPVSSWPRVLPGLARPPRRRGIVSSPRGLQHATKTDTVDTMNASPTSDSLRSRARLGKAARKHLFVVAIVKSNETVAEVARVLSARLKRHVPRSTVQAWYKPVSAPDYRAIPRDAADVIKEIYGVPLSAWSRITD